MQKYQFSSDGSLIAHISNDKNNAIDILQGATGVKVSRIKIPYKVNSTISAMRILEPSRSSNNRQKAMKPLSQILVALSSGDLYKFSEDGQLKQSKKLSSEKILFITDSFIATKNKIYQLSNQKLVTEKYVCNGFYQNGSEVYISEMSHVMILSDRFEEKAQVNIPADSLIWGKNGIVVTAGRSINIGNTSGHTKSVSLISPAQSLACQLSGQYLDVVVHMKNHKCFFVRFGLTNNNVKTASVVHSAELEPEVDAAAIFGTRIRAVKNGSTIMDMIYQDQAENLSQKLVFEQVSQPSQAKTVKAKTANTAVLGKANQVLPGAKYRIVTTHEEANAIMEDQQQDDDNETDDINAILQSGKAVPEMQISGALIRALQRGNVSNLEKIVEVDNQDLISKTVKQVPNYLCVALLDQVIQMYATRAYSARSCTTLLKWIQTIFTVKATFFMGRRDILAIASPLYNTLDAKLDSLNLLLDLSGRLDLVLDMSGISASGDAQSSRKAKKPQTAYESDNEDDMDAFIERYNKGKANLDDEDDFDVIDEEQQQQEEDERDGAAYQDKRGWFDGNQNPDEMSDDELELEKALHDKEKELFGGDDEDLEDLEDDYQDDQEEEATNGDANGDDDAEDFEEDE